MSDRKEKSLASLTGKFIEILKAEKSVDLNAVSILLTFVDKFSWIVFMPNFQNYSFSGYQGGPTAERHLQKAPDLRRVKCPRRRRINQTRS